MACIKTILGFADLESSNLYENLPAQIKMAILSRELILLAILLYEQFIHYRLIYAQTCIFGLLSSVLISHFQDTSWFDSVCFIVEMLGKTVNLNYSALTTMYERDIQIHIVVTSHGAGKVTHHENKI